MNAKKFLLSAACIVLTGVVASAGSANTGPTTPTSPPTGAGAGTTPASPTSPPSSTNASGIASGAVAVVANTADETRKVCRQRDTLGSRLRATRICRTQAEWRRLDNFGRDRAKDLTDKTTVGAMDPRLGGG